MASYLYSCVSERSFRFKGWITRRYYSVVLIIRGKLHRWRGNKSDTSTVVYTQEPFDKFKDRVSLLFQENFNTSNENLTIDRMLGGFCNRIIGVSVAGDGSKPVVDRFILRVPRFHGFPEDVYRAIAPLQLIRQHSTIPIPEVVQFDTTESNPLGKPYSIMKRIPGSPLWSSYDDMTFEARCIIAQSLGKILAEMQSITSTVAGRIVLPASHENSLQGPPMIQPLDKLEDYVVLQRKMETVPHKVGPASMNTFDTIRAIIERQKEICPNSPNNRGYELPFFEEWQTIATEMNDLGMFDQDGYCLCHCDFDSRNVMSQEQTITGIIDWDEALFAPLFLSCTPPMWIWTVGDGYDEAVRFAGEVPSSPELRQIKELFDEAAGPTYVRYAYSPQYRIARILFNFILEGLRGNEDWDRHDQLLIEWKEIRESMRLARNGEESNGLGGQ